MDEPIRSLKLGFRLARKNLIFSVLITARLRAAYSKYLRETAQSLVLQYKLSQPPDADIDPNISPSAMCQNQREFAE